jgi:hypothetical protein
MAWLATGVYSVYLLYWYKRTNEHLWLATGVAAMLLPWLPLLLCKVLSLLALLVQRYEH